MLRPGTQDSLIQSRTNLPNDLNTRQISVMIPPKIRAQSFFSARVAEANILERFREITDSYMTGKIGRDEARNLMLEYARAIASRVLPIGGPAHYSAIRAASVSVRVRPCVRVSPRGDMETETSIQMQIDLCKEYVKEQHGEVIDVRPHF